MGEPIVGIPQGQMAQAAQDAAMNNAWALLTQEVWAVLALIGAGMAAGMAVVGVWRIFLSNIDGDGPRAWAERKVFLTRLGAIVSGVMTLWIELAYLGVLVEVHWFLSVPVALIAAVVAAACNKPFFKPVKAIWKWAMGALGRRIVSAGGDASDLADTEYGRRKP